MQLKITFIFCFVYLSIEFDVQSGERLYVFQHERCDVNVNKDYIYNFTYKCYKLSRKELYLNISLNSNITLESDQNAQILLTGYQFRSNEYRKGPIEFHIGMCSAIKRKDFDIPNILRYSNAKCPSSKYDHFYAYKVYPNASNFPPLIPEGRWKLEIKFIYNKVIELAIINWYARVEYPIYCPGGCNRYLKF